MRVYNNSYPLKLKYKNKDSENINISNYRSVFYSESTSISYLNVDNTSSAIFTLPQLVKLPNTTIESGKSLIVDKDAIVQGSDILIIKPGGELRVI